MKKSTQAFVAALERYSQQLTKFVQTGRFVRFTAKKRARLVRRLEQLQRQAASFAHVGHAKRALAAASVALGLTFNAQAQTFSPTVQVNPFGIQTPNGNYLVNACFGDLDADGDLDIVAGGTLTNAQYQSPLLFYKNVGTATAPQFAIPQTNLYGASTQSLFSFPELVDIDNDGDLDLFVGEVTTYTYGFTGLKYYQNTGTAAAPQFTTPVSTPFGINTSSLFYISSPKFVDIDADGDQDLFIGTYGYYSYGAGIHYYQNTGTATSPAFSTPVASPFGLATPAYSVALAEFGDLDQDGDFDALVGSFPYYDGVLYFQNTGTAAAPAFTNPTLNPYGIALDSTNTNGGYRFVPVLVDVDDDGDLDLFSSVSYDGADAVLAFQQNTSTVGTNPVAQALATARVSPNPAVRFFAVDLPTDLNAQDVTAVVTNALGQTIQTRQNVENNASRLVFQTADWASGVYFVRLSANGQSFTHRVLVK